MTPKNSGKLGVSGELDNKTNVRDVKKEAVPEDEKSISFIFLTLER